MDGGKIADWLRAGENMHNCLYVSVIARSKANFYIQAAYHNFYRGKATVRVQRARQMLRHLRILRSNRWAMA